MRGLNYFGQDLVFLWSSCMSAQWGMLQLISDTLCLRLEDVLSEKHEATEVVTLVGGILVMIPRSRGLRGDSPWKGAPPSRPLVQAITVLGLMLVGVGGCWWSDGGRAAVAST